MELLSPGYLDEWDTWKTLDRLEADVVRTKRCLRMWEDRKDFDCRSKQTE